MSTDPLSDSQLAQTVRDVVARQPVVDLHTHLYPPTFGTPVSNKTGKIDPNGLMLWGVDELISYHYLVAEVYRVVPARKLPYEQFWRMTKQQQADHIWKHLFVERTPVSEACRGILTTLQKLGFDPSDKSLDKWRKHFADQDPSQYIDRVMEVANVAKITMTNPVFDDNERHRWLDDSDVGDDPRFSAVLRIDPLLRDYPAAAKKMVAWGYEMQQEIDERSIQEARRFLNEWIIRMKALYLAVSLPPDFSYPADPELPVARDGQTMIEQVVLPVCAEHNLPFAMMIGSKLQVNPDLRDAGDMVGRADVQAVVNLCRRFPQNKFFVTMLARENQHELAVAARKFSNLMVFGCWWFLNNPSLIDEITRMRMELLGTSFVPQHSDARILDQLIYKWDHSRRLIGDVMIDKYRDLCATGWKLTRSD
nr:glucuronate isomerase [Gemmatimonadaceae bacterium]